MKKSRSKSAPAKTRSIEATDDRTKAAVENQAAAAQALAAAMPHNAIKDVAAAFVSAVGKHRHTEREAALLRR